MPTITSTLYRAAVVFIMIAGLAMPAQADETTTPVVKSITYAAKAELDELSRKADLDMAETQSLELLVQQGFRAESVPSAILVSNISYHYGGDITIYDAFTTLISDFDHDGFYHRFSVAIDADTIYSTSWVYAKLYLSYEGGPWNYYATSDDFHIHGDSELDIHVVETELAEGFPAGYYDILIELYDAEYGDLLHSYGPYDDDSLSTLPLEDSVYDSDYYTTGITTEVVVAGHGGISFCLLAVFAVAGVLRLYRSNRPLTVNSE